MAESNPVTIDLAPRQPDWTAVLREHGDDVTTELHHCDDGYLVGVPFRCDATQAAAIVRAFQIGHEHGVIKGEAQARRAMVKALGL